MFDSFNLGLRTFVLCLIGQSKSISLQHIHSLLFGLVALRTGGVKRLPLGLAFIRDKEGPFSPQLAEVISDLEKEGLIRVAEDHESVAKITLVGQSLATRYAQQEMQRVITLALVAKSQILKLVDEYLHRHSQLGDMISFLPPEVAATKREPVPY